MAKMIPWWAKELSQSVSYVFIKQGNEGPFKSKMFYDLVAPSFLAALVSTINFMAPGERSFFSVDGFFPEIIPFLGILAAFYIAALTAVASIPSSWLDSTMRGPPVTLRKNTINRRQFVLLLFSYLATTAFLMTIVILFLELFHGAAIQFFDPAALEVVRHILIFVMMFILFNLIITSVVGVIFIADRIQSPEKKAQDS